MRKSHKQKVKSRKDKKLDIMMKRSIKRLETYWFGEYEKSFSTYSNRVIPEIDVKDSILTKEKLDECYKLIKEFGIRPLQYTAYKPDHDWMDSIGYFYPMMYGGVTAKNAHICLLPDLVDTEVKS